VAGRPEEGGALMGLSELTTVCVIGSFVILILAALHVIHF